MKGSTRKDWKRMKLAMMLRVTSVLSLDEKLPSTSATVLLPELGVLEILVAAGADFHAELEPLLEFDLVHEFPVLEVPVLDFSQEVEVVGVEQVAVDRGDGPVALAVDEQQGPVHQVAQVGQQLVVVLAGEVRPAELGVTVLGPVDQQVVAPDLGGDVGLELDGVVAEDAGAVGLAELAVLVVEELSSGDGVEEGPWLSGGDEGGGEDDGVEGYVVLPMNW